MFVDKMQDMLIPVVANEKLRQYLVPALGIGAFIFGGLVTRAKVLDGVDIIETRYLGKDLEPLPLPEADRAP